MEMTERQMDIAKRILLNSSYVNGTDEQRQRIIYQLLEKGANREQLVEIAREVADEQQQRIANQSRVEMTGERGTEKNPFSSILGDPLLHLVKFLDYKQLIATCSTNKKFREFCLKNKVLLWKYMISRDYPEIFTEVVRQYPAFSWWKDLYIRITKVKAGTITWIREDCLRLRDSLDLNDPKWTNPSGLTPNTMQGLKIILDENDSRIVYVYPRTYKALHGGAPAVLPGEDHPKIVHRVIFPEMEVEQIPWNESFRNGRILDWRRGLGTVTWLDSLFMYRMEWDGINHSFTVDVAEDLNPQ